MCNNEAINKLYIYIYILFFTKVNTTEEEFDRE